MACVDWHIWTIYFAGVRGCVRQRSYLRYRCRQLWFLLEDVL